MSNERYPLHVAERLRTAQRVQAEQALAQALVERARAQAEVEDIERTIATRAPAQVAAGVAGTIAALELQREAAFVQRNADQARALRAALVAARARLDACEVALRAAQAALGGARAGEHAIERDHARFDALQRREQEQGEQVEVEERVERATRSRNDRGAGQ